MIRIYYYDKFCTRKGKVAGTLIMSAEEFEDFDDLSDDEQHTTAGFAVADCFYIKGKVIEEILRCALRWQQDNDPFVRKVCYNVERYINNNKHLFYSEK